MNKIKYTELADVNREQAKLIKEKDWYVFTECYESGVYYNKGYSWINRIGYVVLSSEPEDDYFDSDEELNKIAIYDEDFATEVRTVYVG